MGTRIVIPRARLSFCNVFEKGQYQGEESKKYECTMLIPVDESEGLIKKLRSLVIAQLKAEYGDKVPAEFVKYMSDKQFGQTDKIFIRDGDNFAYDGYADHWAIKGSNAAQPKLVDADKTPLTKSSGKLYSGCYANALIDFWIMDNSYGKRILANLLGLQFVAHGDPFGAGGVVPDDVIDDFEAVDSDDDSISTDDF